MVHSLPNVIVCFTKTNIIITRKCWPSFPLWSSKRNFRNCLLNLIINFNSGCFCCLQIMSISIFFIVFTRNRQWSRNSFAWLSLFINVNKVMWLSMTTKNIVFITPFRWPGLGRLLRHCLSQKSLGAMFLKGKGTGGGMASNEACGF